MLLLNSFACLLSSTESLFDQSELHVTLQRWRGVAGEDEVQELLPLPECSSQICLLMLLQHIPQP